MRYLSLPAKWSKLMRCVSERRIAGWICLALLVGGLSGRAFGETVLALGEVDGHCAEFGLVKERFRLFSEQYPEPVVYRVGESGLKDWPYIHPSTADGWAGSKAHTYAIHWEADLAPEGALVLSLGVAASFTSSKVCVVLNGVAVGSRRPKKGSDRLAYEPSKPGTAPVTLTYDVPAGTVRRGRNVLSISIDEGSWIIYDFLRLATERVAYDPPDIGGAALAGPLADLEHVVFAARQAGKDGHWYANFSYYAADDNRLTYGLGGKLYRLNIHTGELVALLDDPAGSVRDPQVHYDGGKILFSYLKAGTKHFHLYEINVDGTGLRQLTDGGYDDLEPIYLPDGGIMFVSSRCKRWVNCWLTQVANIHRCDADGGNIRPVSANLEHDNTPWPLPDGRLLYQRWEYVDRSQVHYHHLWTMNPDGTGQMTYYGNLHPGIVMIDAKPIPETNKVAAIFSPGHGARDHDGVLTVVDPRGGPDSKAHARTIRPEADLRDPYPFSEELFLAAKGEEIVLVDGSGKTGVLLRLPREDRKAGLVCHEPRPLRDRARERVIPPRVNPEQPTGQLALANVYEGRSMEGVQPGDIKKLLVVESLPKPVNFTGGMEPLSYGGTFTLERVLGTVPVEPDGSALMELPALRSLFFVALDENDLSVKRMQSFLTVMPGERTSCVGCHEQRTRTARPSRSLLAMERPPSRIEPIANVPEVFDFPRDIQPILDRHCVSCHDYEETDQGGPRSGDVILSGDRGPLYSQSYFMLSARRQMADGRNLPKSNYPPRKIGSSASALVQKAIGGHQGVELSPRELTYLRLWVDTGAPFPGTYAGLGSGMIGGYEQNEIDRTDTTWPSMKQAQKVLRKRCGACHKEDTQLPDSPSDNLGMPPWAVNYESPKLRFSRHILYNLSRPEKSLQLLAPLAKESGGYGLCAAAPAEPVFAGAEDPGYQALLAAIQDTKARLEEVKRFDMAGFRPRPGYIREMQRYGVLPLELAADAPIDTYDADRRYWESFWYRPEVARASSP